MSNTGGEEISAPVQTGPGTHPVSCAMCTGSFLGVESGLGVTLTPHPLLVPRSKKSRAIPLLSLRASVACKKGENYLPKYIQRDVTISWILLKENSTLLQHSFYNI
jgi:hypothetical protein